MTNQEQAIRQLDAMTKPRALGAGVRTDTVEGVAAAKQGTVSFDPIVRNFSEEEWRQKAKKQTLLIIGTVIVLISGTVLLLKYKVIKI